MYPFDNSGLGEMVPQLPPEYLLQEIQRLQRDGVPRRPAPPPIPQIVPPQGDFGGTNPMRLNSIPSNIYDMPPSREQRLGLPHSPAVAERGTHSPLVPSIVGGQPNPYVPSLRNQQPQPPTPGLRPPNPYEKRYHELLAQDPLKARAFMDAWVKENIEKRKASPLAEAIGRSIPRNGYTYGFGGGGLSQGAQDRIARSQANDVRRGMTASQKRQVDTPIVRSNLEQALDALGTPADKNQRAFDKMPTSVPGGGKMFGQRTRAFQNPDGSITLIGGKEFISGQDYTERDVREKGAKESAQVDRRMANVQGVIDRKSAMKSKLQTNRDIKIAENKLKKNPAASIGEPKTAAEAGISAVAKFIQDNPAMKFNNESKRAVYQTAVESFESQKKMANALEVQGLQNQGFLTTALVGQILGPALQGILTDQAGNFQPPEEVAKRFGTAMPYISSIQQMLTGQPGAGIQLPPTPPGGTVEIPPVVTEKTTGMNMAQAEKWMTENKYPAEVVKKRLAEMEKTATPKEIEEAQKKIDNNRAGRRTTSVKKDNRPPLHWTKLFGSLGKTS